MDGKLFYRQAKNRVADGPLGRGYSHLWTVTWLLTDKLYKNVKHYP